MKASSFRIAFSILMCALSAIASAQTFTTLVTFNSRNGGVPLSFLTQGEGGNLLGMTAIGGTSRNCTHGCGTIFRLTQSGALTTLFDFDSYHGSGPQGGLILASDGNFYGTTPDGGENEFGTVFRVTPAGALKTRYRFNGLDGGGPYAPVVQGTDGQFYGTTVIGGGHKNCHGQTCGTIFKISSRGKLTTLYRFNGKDGAWPFSGLVQAADENFYGTTPEGGKHGSGTVFSITPTGSLKQLYSFDGGGPGALVQALDGNFYGTTGGGANGYGTVFRITPEGELATLHNFSGDDGSSPYGRLIQASDGNLYGITEQGGDPSCARYGCGTVFQITLSGTLTTIHSFHGEDGELPYGGLLQDTSGIIYGTTSEGADFTCGGGYGCGAVFSIDMGLGPFVTFVRSLGRVGGTGGILGQGFTGTTAVSLNGTPADFTVVSDTFIKATVPPGATTGYVSVTTPSGVLKSNVPFQVIP